MIGQPEAHSWQGERDDGLTGDEREELRRLRREVARLMRERRPHVPHGLPSGGRTGRGAREALRHHTRMREEPDASLAMGPAG
jgi:hypothetical protein